MPDDQLKWTRVMAGEYTARHGTDTYCVQIVYQSCDRLGCNHSHRHWLATVTHHYGQLVKVGEYGKMRDAKRGCQLEVYSSTPVLAIVDSRLEGEVDVHDH